jgi:hypothetical protein
MTAPQRIYLQVGPDCTPEELAKVDWTGGEVSWCAERVFDTDIEYVRAEEVKKADRGDEIKPKTVDEIHALNLRLPDEQSIEDCVRGMRAPQDDEQEPTNG